MFLANYADGLTDLHLPDMLDFARRQKTIGSFLSVRPSQGFHQIEVHPSGQVKQLTAIRQSNVWMNGGYFVFRQEIFDHLNPGEDLVNEPFQRLINIGQLSSKKHDGFWACMDTYKEMQQLEEMCTQDKMPWQVWKTTTPSRQHVIQYPADGGRQAHA